MHVSNWASLIGSVSNYQVLFSWDIGFEMSCWIGFHFHSALQYCYLIYTSIMYISISMHIKLKLIINYLFNKVFTNKQNTDIINFINNREELT